MSCWICPDKFLTQKHLKNHVCSIHGSLKVVCAFCTGTEVLFKRVSDLKVHARKQHQKELESLPTEMFSENNGYWCSLHPEHYSRLIRPTVRASPAAVMMRTLILDWTKKMGPKASRSREEYLKGWQETDSLALPNPALDLDYLDVEDELHLRYINMIPGTIFVDIAKGTEKIRLIISDGIFTDVQSMRSLTRRIGSLPQTALPFDKFEGEQDDQADVKPFSKCLGIPSHHVTRVLRRAVCIKRKLEATESSRAIKSKKDRPSGMPADEAPKHADPAPALVANDLPDNQASHPAVLSETSKTLVSRTSSPTPVLAKATSLGTSDPGISRLTPSTPPARPVFSAMDSAIPAAKVKIPRPALEPLPPGPSQDYRATKLLKMGGMPHWQPARRSWDQEEAISFAEGETTVFWPPKGWKTLSADQKLLQWEFTAMSILKARGEDTAAAERTEVLDKFNFLALPGTAAHKVSKHCSGYMVTKSRFYTYETLRKIATCSYKDEKWLTMVEAGAMMRDTCNDKLLKTCTNINLRLTKD